MKTKWNFKLFYSSPRSPRIKRDIAETRKNILAFEKKYRRSTSYLSSEGALFRALKDYEKLIAHVGADRAISYYMFRKEIDSRDSEAEAKAFKLSEEFTRLENKLLFFTLKLGKIDAKRQKKLLKNKRLEPYRYFLKNLFEKARYSLSESEEKILNLKHNTSYDLWVDGFGKLLSKQVVHFRNKKIPITKALGLIPTLSKSKRHALYTSVFQKFHEISDFAESEINAVVLHKRANDELRGFKHPYSATILGYENTEKDILRLVDVVSKNFKLAHRFYKCKARILNQSKLRYADRNVPIGKIRKKISFREAVSLYQSVLAELDPEFNEIFNRFLREGRIDVYPKKGKTGGAYCASAVGLPTMVLLNHTDDFRSFMTLAHEMGHAIHAEMSKHQRPLYEGQTISVAETASTLFEQLAFDHIYSNLSPKEKVVALHDKINDDISSIFRQIAFFNFELDLHSKIHNEGFMQKEDIARLLNFHTKRSLGPAFEVSDLDGYFFVAVSHFRRFFYVYSYAYGQLISRAMVQKYKQDKSFIQGIKEFLRLGKSKPPTDIFKHIGINTVSPRFFESGIRSIAGDIKEFEELTTRLGK